MSDFANTYALTGDGYDHWDEARTRREFRLHLFEVGYRLERVLQGKGKRDAKEFTKETADLLILVKDLVLSFAGGESLLMSRHAKFKRKKKKRYEYQYANETVLEFEEHAATGYGPDRGVSIAIPHDGDLPPTELLPGGPPLKFDNGTYIFGINRDEGYRVRIEAVWIPERREWVGIELKEVDEGWRGHDEFITGPYRLSEPFLIALPRTGASAKTAPACNE